jgi:hypothetical protein
MIRLITLFIAVAMAVFSLKSYALTANELFLKIRERNPMVKEEEEKLKAQKSRVATSWQPPTISISEMNSKTPFLDSKMKMQRSLEVAQMFPNPVKLSTDKTIKERNVTVQSEQIELVFKNVRKLAFNLFLELYKNSKEKEILNAKKVSLDKFIGRLQSGQVQGQAERFQIIEGQNDLAEIKILLEQNQNENERMKKMLNQMMGEDFLHTLSTPEILKVDMNRESSSAENLELKSLNSQIAVMEAEVSMKKAEFLPEIELKAKFNKGYTMLYEDSKEVMVGLTLPFIFFGQQKSEVDNAFYKVEAMKYARTNLSTELEAKKVTLKSELQDIAQTLKFLRETSLPIREKKFRLYSGYSYVDMATLMNFKMSIDDLAMMKMKILEKEIEEQKKYYEWTELYN